MTAWNQRYMELINPVGKALSNLARRLASQATHNLPDGTEPRNGTLGLSGGRKADVSQKQ